MYTRLTDSRAHFSVSLLFISPFSLFFSLSYIYIRRHIYELTGDCTHIIYKKLVYILCNVNCAHVLWCQISVYIAHCKLRVHFALIQNFVYRLCFVNYAHALSWYKTSSHVVCCKLWTLSWYKTLSHVVCCKLCARSRPHQGAAEQRRVLTVNRKRVFNRGMPLTVSRKPIAGSIAVSGLRTVLWQEAALACTLQQPLTALWCMMCWRLVALKP